MGLPVKAGTPAILIVLLAGAAICAPAAQAAGPPPLHKLDGHVRALAADAAADRSSTAAERAGLTTRSGDQLLVDIYVRDGLAQARDRLRSLGMQVTASNSEGPVPVVEGWLPLDRASDAAALSDTKAVLPVTGGGTNTGSALSQGDAAMDGPQARAFGPTGSGVTVGVISDTINKVSPFVTGSQTSGDLPGDVQVLSEPASGTDEGRAMAEIVYDTAPGVPTFLFSSGVVGPASKAASINSLVSNGADVIADDTFWLSEPFFQDGQVAQAVDSAKAAGVAYVTSAGNRARQSWEGNFTPATGSYNDFDTSAAEDTEQTVVTMPAGTIPNPSQITLVLQWAEPWGGATTNLDLEAHDINNGNSLIASTNTDNIATGFPIESMTINNTGPAAPVGIKIKRNAGSGTPALKYIARSNFGAFNIAEFPTGSGAIDPDAASAKGALTVGAVRWNQAGHNSPESFSSRGPTTRRFDSAGVPLAAPDVRAKPDVAGPDGVTTSLGSPFNNFLGTSASAPAIAGVAALLRSANPTMTVDQLYSLLEDPFNTIDCTAAGSPDSDCGFGFERAGLAVGQLFDTTPPTITAVTDPPQPDGANGWFRAPVALSWKTIDGGSSIQSSNGCAPATISGDGQFNFSCTAASRGGGATGSTAFKHDGTPPATPAFKGIAAKTFKGSTLPAGSAIGCSSSDPTSGLERCTVDGYSADSGKHTLTATATNGAGATSTATLAYELTATIGSLKAKRVGLSSALRSGIPLTVKATESRTRISAVATAALQGSSKTLTVGKLTKTLKRGRTKLTLKLNAKGKKALRKAGHARLTLLVTGKSGRASTTLKRSISLH